MCIRDRVQLCIMMVMKYHSDILHEDSKLHRIQNVTFVEMLTKPYCRMRIRQNKFSSQMKVYCRNSDGTYTDDYNYFYREAGQRIQSVTHFGHSRIPAATDGRLSQLPCPVITPELAWRRVNTPIFPSATLCSVNIVRNYQLYYLAVISSTHVCACLLYTSRCV